MKEEELQQRSRRDRIRDVATIATGAGVGAGLGYLGAQHLTKSQTAKALRKVAPSKRLRYMQPTSKMITTGAIGVTYLRDQKRREIEGNRRQQRNVRKLQQEKRAFIENWVYNSLLR